jgi:hypothetical protein
MNSNRGHGDGRYCAWCPQTTKTSVRGAIDMVGLAKRYETDSSSPIVTVPPLQDGPRRHQPDIWLAKVR